MNMLLKLARLSREIIEVPIETIYIQNNAGTHFHAIWDSLSIYGEILKFAASSFIGFLVDYLLYSFILLILGTKGILVANILARVVSASVNFRINYKYVFQSQESVLKSALKYFALACFILSCNSSLLYFLTIIIGLNPYFAKIAVELLLFFVSWLVQRTIVFTKQ